MFCNWWIKKIVTLRNLVYTTNKYHEIVWYKNWFWRTFGTKAIGSGTGWVNTPQFSNICLQRVVLPGIAGPATGMSLGTECEIGLYRVNLYKKKSLKEDSDLPFLFCIVPYKFLHLNRPSHPYKRNRPHAISQKHMDDCLTLLTFRGIC